LFKGIFGKYEHIIFSFSISKESLIFVHQKYEDKESLLSFMSSAMAKRGYVSTNFFETVMVNAEDPALRANRLALLKRLYGVMNAVAEISRLAK
jgi:glycyl-tRNA synthetase beta subunit